MKKLAVAFDTSNYTTSCAYFDGDDGDNIGLGLNVPEGALGIRQSDALFAHVKYLPGAFSKLEYSGEIAAVGASVTPREAENSYMPCFLAGSSQGVVLAKALGVPFYSFSHQQGHVSAAAWSAGRDDLMNKPMLCWHLSGGTTELLRVKPKGVSVTCEIIGGTSDISAGQLIDRCGKYLSFQFPSGRQLDALAVSFAGTCGVYSPKPKGLTFSLSGVEHKMRALIDAGREPSEIAYFVFRAVSDVVKSVTEKAIKDHGDLPVLFSGGVASSAFLRREISGGIFCEPEYSTDNALGVAILTHRAVTADGG